MVLKWSIKYNSPSIYLKNVLVIIQWWLSNFILDQSGGLNDKPNFMHTLIKIILKTNKTYWKHLGLCLYCACKVKLLYESCLLNNAEKNLPMIEHNCRTSIKAFYYNLHTAPAPKCMTTWTFLMQIFEW